MPRPHFTIKNRFQKRSELYEDILTEDILRDVCQRITGVLGGAQNDIYLIDKSREGNSKSSQARDRRSFESAIFKLQ